MRREGGGGKEGGGRAGGGRRKRGEREEFFFLSLPVFIISLLSNSNTHLASGTLKFRMSGEDLTDTLKCNSIFYKFSFEFVRLFCL